MDTVQDKVPASVNISGQSSVLKVHHCSALSRLLSQPINSQESEHKPGFRFGMGKKKRLDPSESTPNKRSTKQLMKQYERDQA